MAVTNLVPRYYYAINNQPKGTSKFTQITENKRSKSGETVRRNWSNSDRIMRATVRYENTVNPKNKRLKLKYVNSLKRYRIDVISTNYFGRQEDDWGIDETDHNLIIRGMRNIIKSNVPPWAKDLALKMSAGSIMNWHRKNIIQSLFYIF